jgi:hypothetical protein
MPVAVMADEPLDPWVIETAAAESVYEAPEGSAPVPERAMVCGEPVTLSAILTEAVSDPTAAGAKVTVMEQLAPIARPVPQVLVCEKELTLEPVIVMPLMASGSVPLLVTVTDCAGAAVPTRVPAKVNEASESDAVGATEVAKAFTTFATFREPRPVATS